mgnify:FL=1|tara:strand:- start:373 stop:576 length:204 start_codon:yes stop_codon:yes gene_type:complete
MKQTILTRLHELITNAELQANEIENQEGKILQSVAVTTLKMIYKEINLLEEPTTSAPSKTKPKKADK